MNSSVQNKSERGKKIMECYRDLEICNSRCKYRHTLLRDKPNVYNL